jgi:hypothetical protein
MFNILLKTFIRNCFNNFEISVFNNFDCTLLFTPFSPFVQHDDGLLQEAESAAVGSTKIQVLLYRFKHVDFK